MKNKYHSLTEQFETRWLSADSGVINRTGQTLIEYESVYQHLEIMESPVFGRSLRLNGYTACTTSDSWLFHENLIHVPAITHPNPSKAIIIGGGDGGAAYELLKHPTLHKLTVCEIDASVVAIADEYLTDIHQHALHDVRVELEFCDGMDYLKRLTGHVDLIYFDVTQPIGYEDPAFNLVFFQQCAALLGELGLFAMHLGSAQYQTPRCQYLLSVLSSVFAVVRPILVPMPRFAGYWVMVCASQMRDPKMLEPVEIENRLAERGIGDLRFYNAEMHHGMMAIPNDLKMKWASSPFPMYF